MSTTVHRIYIAIMSLIVLATLLGIGYYGYSYYRLPVEERFFSGQHQWLKPSGPFGHGFGIAGTLFMTIGVFFYMARKRIRTLSRMGTLKYWLEFHIFLCTLGPILVLYHTSMKFGGLVSISFWSMVAVFLSGIIGRFIYIQIPRTIEGRELTLNEVKNQRQDIVLLLKNEYNLDEESYRLISKTLINNPTAEGASKPKGMLGNYFADRRFVKQLKRSLKVNQLSKSQKREVLYLVKGEISLNGKIERLTTMQNLFKYWHVAHLPFAFVMLIIMIIHVVVTIVFGYRWIF